MKSRNMIKRSTLFHNIVYLDTAWKSSGRKIKDLYDILDINASTYTRWKTGLTLPDRYNTEAMANMIGIKPEEFKTVPLEELEGSVFFLKKLQLMKIVENASDETVSRLLEYLKSG